MFLQLTILCNLCREDSLAGELTTSKGLTLGRDDATTHIGNMTLELQRVTRDNLALPLDAIGLEEVSAILRGILHLTEDKDATALRQGLDDEHTRHYGL